MKRGVFTGRDRSLPAFVIEVTIGQQALGDIG